MYKVCYTSCNLMIQGSLSWSWRWMLINFRLIRLSINVKNVRATAKILEKECIPSKTVEGRKGQHLPRARCVLVLLWVSSPHGFLR